MSTFDFSRFKIMVFDASIFFREYAKIDLKFRDPEGFFGAKNYDYFVYGNKELINQNGSSQIHLLIHNKKSLEKMRTEIKEIIFERMKDFQIDIAEIEEKDKVIVAIDPNGLIGRGSTSIFFITPQRKEIKNGTV
jgi:hypothetical protein